jgi:hypothetical protein
LVYAVIEAPAHGWTSTWTAVALGAALALVTVFIAWEMRHHTPMLDVRLFGNPSFSAASTSITLAFFALAGAIFMVTQYLQFVLGYSPLRAGVGILPAAAAVALAAPLSAHVAQHVGARLTITAGLLLAAAGFSVQAMFAESTFLPIAVGQALFGLGLGLAMAPATESIMASLPAERAGVGSAVNDTTREVGSALGVAVIGSVAASVYADHVGSRVDSLGLSPEVAAAVKDNVGATAHVANELDPATSVELMHIAREGFVSAMHIGMWIGAAVATLGAVIALTKLPSHQRHGSHGQALTATSDRQHNLVGATHH